MKGWSNLILGVARLFLKGGRRAIGFDLASIGELQWCRGIIESFASRHPKDLIYIFHHDATQDQFDALCPKLRGRVTHVPFGHIHRRCFRKLDLYVTTEEFNPGPPTVYTVTVFHSQGAKGVAFYLPHSDPLKVNDALFLYGTYQRESLYEHLEMWRRELPPHLSLYDIGYPKSDDLINGKFVREEILVEMGLDPKKRTILYAPAFNEGASMRECGIEILETLCALKEFNILAKLAIDCLRPTTDFYSTGGVDWFKTIGRLEGRTQTSDWFEVWKRTPPWLPQM